MVEAAFVGLVVGNGALLGKACAPWGIHKRVRAVFGTGMINISYNKIRREETKVQNVKLTYPYINSRQIVVLVDRIYKGK